MTASTDRMGRGTILALVAMAASVFVVANDFTALSVAIPAIEQDLETDLTTAQWVINAYALVFGVLIVTGGRLADLVGRRRVFVIGAIIFATFSVVGGLAPNAGFLIGCRMLMGVGGAMMWPAILGMTFAILPEDKAGLAGGLILGVAGFGNAVGPMLGGLLTELLSWRWIFFVNLPIAAIAITITLTQVDESRGDDPERRMDYRGIALLTAGAVAFLLALDNGTTMGWDDPVILGLFAVGVATIVAFAVVEPRTGPRALIPKDVITNRDFAAACGAVLLVSAIFFAALLYLPQFMVKELGFSALRSGVGLLPVMGVFALTSFVAGWMYDRLGPKIIVSVGAALLGIGILALSFLDADSSYVSLVPGMVVLGVGIGLFYSSITTAGVTALDPSRSSLAGGIIYMFQITGGAIGLGLNTAIIAGGSSMPEGIRVAFRVDAVLALVGLVLAIAFIGGGVHPQRRHTLRGHHRAHA